MAAIFRTLISSQEPLPPHPPKISLPTLRKRTATTNDSLLKRLTTAATRARSLVQPTLATAPPPRPRTACIYVLHEHGASSPRTGQAPRYFRDEGTALAAARGVWAGRYGGWFGAAFEGGDLRGDVGEGRRGKGLLRRALGRGWVGRVLATREKEKRKKKKKKEKEKEKLGKVFWLVDDPMTGEPMVEVWVERCRIEG